MTESKTLQIRLDPIEDKQVIALLEAHLETMYATSPPESVFALDLEGLRAPELSFWSIWQGETAVGCGALKEHSAELGEIKSMHTRADYRGNGAGGRMLEHILNEAAARGYKDLKLETGSHPAFMPAQRLYLRHGFEYCGAFPPYQPNEFSVFMHRALSA